MTPELLKLASHIMTISFFVLLYTAIRAWFDEKERRKFYQSRYYQDPRVHHYKKKKGFWLFRIFMILILFSSCTKLNFEEIPMRSAGEVKCYDCTVNVPGIWKSFDTCMVDLRALDLRNSNGVGLPWICREKR